MIQNKRIKCIFLIIVLILSTCMLSACRQKRGNRTEGSFKYKLTFDVEKFAYSKGDVYEYFQCIDTIGSSVGQGVRVTRYENDYDFSVVIDAINNQTERGFVVDKLLIGKKSYKAKMVRFNFATSDGNLYTECDYQVTYGNVSLLITAVYDVDHAGDIAELIGTLDLN